MMKPFRQFLEEKLADKLSGSELKLLPSGYQKIGDVVILNLSPGLKKHEKEICRLALKELKARTVCVKSGGVSGKKREPAVRKVAGGGTEAVHTENGCKYCLDVTKVMFAKGNVSERGRLAKLVRPGETIVDMFAGIGYFSIPIAKACPSCNIISIDVNPVSASYLTKNCRLNRVANIQPVLGDCREVRPGKVADRVLMGYLPGTAKFLPAAFSILKDRGVIHFHDVYSGKELWKKPLGELENAAGKAGYRMEKVLRKGIVKQYAPRVYHVVIDASFRKLRGKGSRTA